MRFLLVAARRGGSFSRKPAAPAMAQKTMAELIQDHGRRTAGPPFGLPQNLLLYTILRYSGTSALN
jgi:hypothetical protein